MAARQVISLSLATVVGVVQGVVLMTKDVYTTSNCAGSPVVSEPNILPVNSCLDFSSLISTGTAIYLKYECNATHYIAKIYADAYCRDVIAVQFEHPLGMCLPDTGRGVLPETYQVLRCPTEYPSAIMFTSYGTSSSCEASSASSVSPIAAPIGCLGGYDKVDGNLVFKSTLIGVSGSTFSSRQFHSADCSGTENLTAAQSMPCDMCAFSLWSNSYSIMSGCSMLATQTTNSPANSTITTSATATPTHRSGSVNQTTNTTTTACVYKRAAVSFPTTEAGWVACGQHEQNVQKKHCADALRSAVALPSTDECSGSCAHMHQFIETATSLFIINVIDVVVNCLNVIVGVASLVALISEVDKAVYAVASCQGLLWFCDLCLQAAVCWVVGVVESAPLDAAQILTDAACTNLPGTKILVEFGENVQIIRTLSMIAFLVNAFGAGLDAKIILDYYYYWRQAGTGASPLAGSWGWAVLEMIFICEGFTLAVVGFSVFSLDARNNANDLWNSLPRAGNETTEVIWCASFVYDGSAPLMENVPVGCAVSSAISASVTWHALAGALLAHLVCWWR